MPDFSPKRAFLSPDLIVQLKTLFDKAPNVHARLGLHEIVQLSDVQKALAGWPVPQSVERVLNARWVEWREKFMNQPAMCEREQLARQRGDYYDPDARDPITEELTFPIDRFTLIPDARKYL